MPLPVAAISSQDLTGLTPMMELVVEPSVVDGAATNSLGIESTKTE
jgi:hypothetical protein